MNARGRRTQRRAEERRTRKAEQRKLLPLQLSFRPRKKREKR
jgi:hypothetical protein